MEHFLAVSCCQPSGPTTHTHTQSPKACASNLPQRESLPLCTVAKKVITLVCTWQEKCQLEICDTPPEHSELCRKHDSSGKYEVNKEELFSDVWVVKQSDTTCGPVSAYTIIKRPQTSKHKLHTCCSATSNTFSNKHHTDTKIYPEVETGKTILQNPETHNPSRYVCIILHNRQKTQMSPKHFGWGLPPDRNMASRLFFVNPV